VGRSVRGREKSGMREEKQWMMRGWGRIIDGKEGADERRKCADESS
jgi:hypothetical protein